jgi:hypothetical protein
MFWSSLLEKKKAKKKKQQMGFAVDQSGLER